MKVSKELRERIKQLESEQNRQQDDLADLDSLRNLVEIEALEKELVDIHQDQNSNDALSTLDDINLDFEEIFDQDETKSDTLSATADTIHDIDLDELVDLDTDNKPTGTQTGFIVCLLFNKAKPSEWSEEAGGGWRGPDMGTRYPSQAKAQAVMEQLKKKWPDYPIKILS